MMNESTPFASLSSSLLARKGQAKPAMRPQAYLQSGKTNPSGQFDDLGWNDMGEEAPTVAPVLALVSPAPVAESVSLRGDPIPDQTEAPAIVVQHTELARAMTAPTPETVADNAEVVPAEEVGHPRARLPRTRAAFTLRLDEGRHLQLRLACAVSRRSAQHMVTQALDEFLASRPVEAALASLKTR